jgi:hypothetical protein
MSYKFVSATVIGGVAAGRIININPSIRSMRLSTTKFPHLTEFDPDSVFKSGSEVSAYTVSTYTLEMIHVGESTFHFLIPEGRNSAYLIQELTRSYINQCEETNDRI